MRFSWAALVVAAILVSRPAAADDHLVATDQVQSALAGAEAQRQSDLASLGRALTTPAAERAAERAGVDLDQVRRQLPALSDAEAHDLAQRASALETDPAAGLLGTLTDLVFLAILVILVILLARKL